MHLDIGSGLHCAPVYSVKGFTESSVYDDAISLWLLNEASGTRADSIGSNDLTDNNTVLYRNMGPSGTVAKFTAATSESLTGTVSATTAFSVGFWWYPSSSDDRNEGLIALASGWDNPSNFQCYRYATGDPNNVSVRVHFTDSVSGGVDVSKTALLPDRWHFVSFTYSDSDKIGRLYIDGVLVGTGSALTNGITTSPTSLRIGNNLNNEYSNSKIARVGLWSAVIDTNPIYNVGKGKAYADLTTAEKVGLVSYWDLDETSGDRADSHGSNTLTDNNTVGSATNSYPANLPGRVASFVAANSEYLSLAGDSTLDLNGDDYTFAFWVKFTTLPGELYPLGRDTAGLLTQYYFNSTASSVTFTAQDDPFSSTTTVSTGGGSVSTATWYLVVAGREGSNLFISLDGGAKTTGALTITPATGAATFFLGARRAAYGHMNGQMSAVAVWDRALAADDITNLFNSGNGAPLP